MLATCHHRKLHLQNLLLVALDGFDLNSVHKLSSNEISLREKNLSVCLSDFSAKSISSQGFGAGELCHTFLETGGQGKQNVLSGILIFGPRPKKTGLEGGGGRGCNQNFGI